MRNPDLNLLVTLDVLLTEGSVARASRRLQLSASAMSRALARLRALTGDPILVRAGRGLVPTPRAAELRGSIGRIVEEARAILRPGEAIDVSEAERSFTIRSSDGFVENFGPEIVARVGRKAPGVQLNFVPKPDKDSASLRDGSVDLETGVIGPAMGPEIRAQALFRDRFVGVVRRGHPLARGRMTIQRYADGRHVLAARRGGPDRGPVEDALAASGQARRIVARVGGFSAALSLARDTELIATVPERHTGRLRKGMHSFALPFAVPEIPVSMFWHPRHDADPVHRWLRECVRAVAASRSASAR
ncbi:MAG: LysR family transcriptional regulator [Rhodospirillales bacterium]|nr:LysR family transcriptional regulator [Rhodospirillales bacterium]